MKIVARRQNMNYVVGLSVQIAVGEIHFSVLKIFSKHLWVFLSTANWMQL